jgi:hypothetical protein
MPVPHLLLEMVGSGAEKRIDPLVAPFYALELHHNKPLRTALKEVWKEHPDLSVHHWKVWWWKLVELPASCRLPFIRSIRALTLVQLDAEMLAWPLIHRCAAAFAGNPFERRIVDLFYFLARGGSQATAMDWLEVEAQYRMSVPLGGIGSDSRIPWKQVEAFLGRYALSRIHRLSMLFSSWSGLFDLWKSETWFRLDQPLREKLFDCFVHIGSDSDRPENWLELWNSLPDDRLTLATELLSVLAWHPECWQTILTAPATLLSEWLSMTKTSHSGTGKWIWLYSIYRQYGKRLEWASFPASTKTILYKAAADRRLREGVEMLLPKHAELVVEAIEAAPKWLAELAEQLSLLSPVEAQRFLKAATQVSDVATRASAANRDRLNLFQFNSRNLVHLDQLLLAHPDLAQRLPEWKTWNLHFSGVKPLSLTSIEEVAQRIRRKRPMLQIQYLLARLEDRLDPDLDHHAQRMANSLQLNRRALRRFLRDLREGNDQRLNLPANRNWMEKQTWFRLEDWLQLPEFTMTLASGETVTVGPESNPFEILRSGTYVNSCLSLGACNAHSAVSVLLDVNKRVIFVRDQNGKFLGRQIVALADDHRLICYQVYATRNRTELEELLWNYVQHVAWILSVPISVRTDYVVQPLAAPNWYDDGIWGRLALQEDAQLELLSP